MKRSHPAGPIGADDLAKPVHGTGLSVEQYLRALASLAPDDREAVMAAVLSDVPAVKEAARNVVVEAWKAIEACPGGSGESVS